MPHQETPLAYVRLPSYPHLSTTDTDIWNRYIDAHPGAFLRVWYDFRVGDEDEIPEDVPPTVGKDWWDLSYWRIDVIAEDRDTLYIIEVKPMANSKAIGQALAYANIYTTDENPGKPVVPVVLTDRILPTTKRVAAALNVELWVA